MTPYGTRAISDSLTVFSRNVNIVTNIDVDFFELRADFSFNAVEEISPNEWKQIDTIRLNKVTLSFTTDSDNKGDFTFGNYWSDQLFNKANHSSFILDFQNTYRINSLLVNTNYSFSTEIIDKYGSKRSFNSDSFKCNKFINLKIIKEREI